MTNREVINAFLETASDSGGRISQDPFWSKRLIFFYLKLYKNKIVNEAIVSKNYPINRANYITIPCIKLEKLDQASCPCIPPSGRYFLKTVYPVPRSLFGKYTSVTSVLGNQKLDYVRWDTVKSKLNSIFEAERTTAFYTLQTIDSETHLYLYNDLDKEFLTITDVFEDDLEAFYYPDCQGNVKSMCSPLDQDFIIDKRLLPIVFEMTYEKLIKLKGIAPSDVLNNEIPDGNMQTLK